MAFEDLSEKHKEFVNNYFICSLNATEAYHRTYAPESRAVSASNGYRLLRNAEIAEAVSERMAESAMSADEVIYRLAEQARGLPPEYMTTKGTVKIAQLVRDGKTHLIKKISDTAQGRMYEFYDAHAALVDIGKHHALFVDKTEQKIDGKLEIEYVNDWRET